MRTRLPGSGSASSRALEDNKLSNRSRPPCGYTAQVAVHRLSPGDVFASDYEVQRVIGAGSMGIVYRALHRNTAQDVALKLMHSALAEDPKAVHRFEREARALMSVHSRHVARVIDTGCDEATGMHWMAMDLAEGSTLTEYVAAHDPLPEALAIDLLHQLFAAMASAHSVGVVHRDLKPDNIVVCTAEVPPLLKVLDFGIAKSLNSATAISTSPGQGTPLWTSPEQSRLDDKPHPRSDVWALGLLTFYVLTGKVYWKHAQGRLNMVQLSMELMRNPIEAASVRATELGVLQRLPPRFDQWFEHCVNRDAGQRFDNASAALQALMILMERRGRPRHRLWLPVYCDALSGGVAITHDASDNGMMLLARSKPEEGEQLTLRFSVPPGEGEVFVCQARVVRSDVNKDDPDGLWRYQLAVTYGNILPQLGPLLAQLEAELGTGAG